MDDILEVVHEHTKGSEELGLNCANEAHSWLSTFLMIITKESQSNERCKLFRVCDFYKKSFLRLNKSHVTSRKIFNLLLSQHENLI